MKDLYRLGTYMDSKIFISYATHDIVRVRDIYQKLSLFDLDMWVSFKDIFIGVNWDEAIEAAMNNSSHVIVITSEASIASSYVRAEVEYALDKGKVVIPLLIEPVQLPLRWHTLQYIDLTTGDEESKLRNLSKHLPQNTVATLEHLLLKSTDSSVLHNFILEHVEHWETTNVLLGENIIDIFYSYIDSVDGANRRIAKITYLGSANSLPTSEDGDPSDEIIQKLEVVYNHVNILSQTIQNENILGITRSTSYYVPETEPCVGFEISLYWGQRQYYSDEQRLHRRYLEATWEAKLFRMLMSNLKAQKFWGQNRSWNSYSLPEEMWASRLMHLRIPTYTNLLDMWRKDRIHGLDREPER